MEPTILRNVFKFGSLPTIWHSFVEFRSMTCVWTRWQWRKCEICRGWVNIATQSQLCVGRSSSNLKKIYTWMNPSRFIFFRLSIAH